MRIDVDVMPAHEQSSATRAASVLRAALAPVAHRISRVCLRREPTRWFARVALVDGSSLDVEQATPAEDGGALDHFADRIARAVARRLGHCAGVRR